MGEIIIDGVCINNCQYGKIIPYDYPTSGIDIECYIDYQNEITKDCKENHNCLYKQLKRLEQENEELKNILKEIDKKLELALDVEQTDAEESFDLLYEIQEIITEAIGE